MNRWQFALPAALLAGCWHADAAPPGDDPALRVEWPSYAGDPGSRRYSPLRDIRADNLDRLRLAWVWHPGERPAPGSTGDARGSARFEATPLMLGDTLYLSTANGSAAALDANTGREYWRFAPFARGEDPPAAVERVHRGVAIGRVGRGRRVFLNAGARLYALDAASGRPAPEFGPGGSVDLTKGLAWPVRPAHFGSTSPPVLWQDRVIVGSSIPDAESYPRDPPGNVQAFDAGSGRLLWSWDPIPRSGQRGSETWERGSHASAGHANVWAPFSVDTVRGLLYLPVSAASNDWYGGRRPGANLYAESLVCLDARTGTLVWHAQLVHHGLWDYDPPAPPILFTLQRDGRPVEVVAQLGKTGFAYVFERVSGRPYWPIEERPVPASDVPGERAWPTQPVPTRPPAFARQGITEADLVDLTPALRAAARERVAPHRLGPLFTPPSLAGTVVVPGWIGGAGWGGGALDPERGMLYVKATNQAVLARLVAAPDPAAGYVLDRSASPSARLDLPLPTRSGVWRRFGRTVGIPILRPPYGTLTAFDLADGTLRWRVTLGDTPAVRFHPALRRLGLPPLGVAGAPGPLLTGSGLLFLTGGGDVLYALDAATGAERWRAPLGRVGYANPMTYRTAAGRQFVVVATGEGERAALLAFALARE